MANDTEKVRSNSEWWAQEKKDRKEYNLAYPLSLSRINRVVIASESGFPAGVYDPEYGKRLVLFSHVDSLSREIPTSLKREFDEKDLEGYLDTRIDKSEAICTNSALYRISKKLEQVTNPLDLEVFLQIQDANWGTEELIDNLAEQGATIFGMFPGDRSFDTHCRGEIAGEITLFPKSHRGIEEYYDYFFDNKDFEINYFKSNPNQLLRVDYVDKYIEELLKWTN
jgi:hypothetical protein